MARLERSRWICIAAVGLAWAAFAQPASAATRTYLFTGGEQTYTVPAGVRLLHVVAVGARGGSGSDIGPNIGGSGGFGARVEAELAVMPGQMLFIEVGGIGADGGHVPSGGGGGFNGGGSSSSVFPFDDPGGGGGGATDLRACSRLAASCAVAPDTLHSRLIVAAGGGGGGSLGRLQLPDGGEGGNAGDGGRSGQTTDCGGTPGGGGGAGTESSGGAGGAAGTNGGVAGNPGIFGQGGAAGISGSDAEPGGGGGGGYFGAGAGGGANGCGGGGGGGGSSFATAAASGVSTTIDTTGIPLLAITSPDRDFAFGPLRRNRRAGTAILAVDVPGPGTLELSGTGLVPQGATAAGEVPLTLSTRGRKERRLKRAGRVNVTTSVTYTRVGADPITKTLRVTLVKRHAAKHPCTSFCGTG